MKIHFRMSGTELRHVCGLTPEARGGPGEHYLEWWIHKGLASPTDGRDRLYSIAIPVDRINAAGLVHDGQEVEVCEACLEGAKRAVPFWIGRKAEVVQGSGQLALKPGQELKRGTKATVTMQTAPPFDMRIAPFPDDFNLPAVYGSPDGGLHPDRSEVVLEAMERYEAGKPTKADLVLLWFDSALNDALCELEKAGK